MRGGYRHATGAALNEPSPWQDILHLSKCISLPLAVRFLLQTHKHTLNTRVACSQRVNAYDTRYETRNTTTIMDRTTTAYDCDMGGAHSACNPNYQKFRMHTHNGQTAQTHLLEAVVRTTPPLNYRWKQLTRVCSILHGTSKQLKHE